MYNLSGGNLTVTGEADLGFLGTGVFNQTGGAVTFNGQLRVASQAGSVGAVPRWDRGGGDEQVGGADRRERPGECVQSGGTHTVAGPASVGHNAAGSGTASLSGGSWTATATAYVGNGGAGDVPPQRRDISRRGLRPPSGLALAVGRSSGGAGSYGLSNTATLNVNGGEEAIGVRCPASSTRRAARTT